MRKSKLYLTFIFLFVFFSIFVGCENSNENSNSIINEVDNNVNNKSKETINNDNETNSVNQNIQIPQIHVSLDGNDENTATIDSPLKSIDGAKLLLRNMIKDGMDTDIEVVIHKGDYIIDGSVSFDERDSGKDGHYVIYKNYEDDKVSLKGSTGNVLEFYGSSMEDTVSSIKVIGLELDSCKSKADSGWDDKETGGNGVFIENAKDIHIIDCHIHDMEASGVYLHVMAQNNTVSGCYIHDVNKNGIYLRGKFISGPESDYNFGNNILNNHIYSCLNGSGIILWQSGDNLIRNNIVHKVGQYCMSFKSLRPGNVAGRKIDGVKVTSANVREYRNTDHNICEYNMFSDANYNASDTGVIEAWGSGVGNVIRSNYIFGSATQSDDVFVIYLDDASDGFLIENNIFSNIPKSNAVFFVKGIGNVIRNNIIDNCSSGSVFLSREMFSEPNYDLVFENNLITKNSGNLYTFANWREERVKRSENNFYEKSTLAISGIEGVKSFEDWKNVLGFDLNSVIGKAPKYMNEKNDDYRLKYDSSAREIGCVDINQPLIGVTSEYKYSDLNEDLKNIFIISDKSFNKAFAQMEQNEELNLSIIARTNTGFIAPNSDLKISYNSNNNSIATVDDLGKVTSKKAGITTISASVIYNGKEYDASYDIIVEDNPKKISLLDSIESLSLDDTRAVKAIITYESGYSRILDNDEFIIKSKNGKTIIEDKVIKPIELGSEVFILEEKEHNLIEEIPLTIVSAFIDYLSINPDNSIVKVGETISIGVKGYNSNSEEIILSDDEVDYILEDDYLKEISKGVYESLKPGVSKISVLVKAYGTTIKGECSIIIRPDEEATIPNWSLTHYMNASGFAIENDGVIDFYSDGRDIFDIEDDFSYLYKIIPENQSDEFVVTTKILELEDLGDRDSAVGIMIRNNDSKGSKHVNLRVLPSFGTRYIFRKVENSESDYQYIDEIASYPIQLKIKKENDIFTSYVFIENEWVEIGSAKISMEGDLMVGISLMSHVNDKYIHAKIDEFSVTSGGIR